MDYLQGRKQCNEGSNDRHSSRWSWWRSQVQDHKLLGGLFGALVKEVARWANSVIRGLVQEATNITGS